MSEPDVLVVGAGPTGLTMAAELLRHGASCRLVDELREPQTISKAAVVHARTMELFDAMGVAGEVAARSRIVRAMNVFSGGKRVVHVEMSDIDSPYPHPYGISQHDVEQILAAHVSRLGGRIERGVTLEGFAQDDAGVTATLVRADGTRETARARWLVGCDGAHSRVRKVLGFAFEGAPYEERLVQADVRVSLPLVGVEDEIITVLGEGDLLALFPLFADGRYRLIVTGGPEADATEPTLELFQQALDRRLPGARASDPAWMTSFRIHHRHVDRYRDGRVFIAGDAGHIHSPVGGQGMNTGIQDAINLAWKLALVARGRGAGSLLDTYGAERLPIAQALVGKTDRAMKALEAAMEMRHPLAIGLRNQLMSFVTRLGAVQSRAARNFAMLDQGYRGGPLSAQDRPPVWKANVATSGPTEAPSLADWAAFGEGPAPGERAPDAPFTRRDAAGAAAGQGAVHELLRAGKLVLLLFDGAAATAAGYANLSSIAKKVRERAGVDVAAYAVVPTAERPAALGADDETLGVLHDEDGAMHKRYGARSECLYLVRPDGYVGYRCQPADGDELLAYLDRVFASYQA